METTIRQADQGKAAAERLLLTVNHVRQQLRRAPLPHETPENVRTGWSVDFKLLRKQIEAEKAVLTPAHLAGLRHTSCYPVDAEYAAPTAPAAALALACRVYRVLGDTLDGLGLMSPVDLEEAYSGEPERGLCELLESTDQAARFWRAVAGAVGKLETGRDLWPALERECPPEDGPAGDDRDWMLVSEAVAELPFIRSLKHLDAFVKEHPDKLRLRKHPRHAKRRQAHRADVQRLAQEHAERAFDAMDSPGADSLPAISDADISGLAARVAAMRQKKTGK